MSRSALQWDLELSRTGHPEGALSVQVGIHSARTRRAERGSPAAHVLCRPVAIWSANRRSSDTASYHGN